MQPPRPLKLIYFTHYFPPETGAAAERAYRLVHDWTNLGAEVTVVTGLPNYKLAKVDDTKEIPSPGDRFKVIRLKNLSSDFGSSFFRRLIKQIYFSISGCWTLSRLPGDLIVVSSPPFFSGMTALFLRKLLGKPYIFEVRDLYPESAVVYGRLKNRWLIKCLRAIEKKIYDNAEAVVPVTKHILTHINNLGIDKNRLWFITNGVDNQHFRFIEKADLPPNFDLQDKFVVIYLGLMGSAQGLTTLIEAADLLRNEERILILLVGDGVEKKVLQQEIGMRGLRNIQVHDGIGRDLVPQLLSRCHLGLALLKGGTINEGALPSKAFVYLACGLPVIVTPVGECAQVLALAQAGEGVAAQDPAALARAILDYSKKSPAELEAIRKRAIKFVAEHYNGRQLSSQYLGNILAMLKQSYDADFVSVDPNLIKNPKIAK